MKRIIKINNIIYDSFDESSVDLPFSFWPCILLSGCICAATWLSLDYFSPSSIFKIIIFVVLVHELGHAFALKAFKIKDVCVIVLPLGGGTLADYSVLSDFKKSLVFLAGPLPGIIIGFLLYIGNVLNWWDVNMQVSFYFLLLNFFNLLPLPPLDGGRFVETLLSYRNRIFFPIFQASQIIVLVVIIAWHFHFDINNIYFWGIVSIIIPCYLKSFFTHGHLFKIETNLRNHMSFTKNVPLKKAPYPDKLALIRRLVDEFPQRGEISLPKLAFRLWCELQRTPMKLNLKILLFSFYFILLLAGSSWYYIFHISV